jgi:hypothetical protein
MAVKRKINMNDNKWASILHPIKAGPWLRESNGWNRGEKQPWKEENGTPKSSQ